MKSIGIIGTGFVGSAVRDGMKHAFDVYTHDKKFGTYTYSKDLGTKAHSVKNPLEWLVANVGGPIFICLPTPMKKDGSCDTSIVESVVKDLNDIAEKTRRNRASKEVVVVIKSTVPPGTTQRLDDSCRALHVCFNPEFLTEATAAADFKNQDRIIVGGPREGTTVVKQMYTKAYPNVPVTKTSSSVAEMVKYTTNIFLASKISIANEIKQLCDNFDDVDYDKVIEYATKDKRLGTSHWLVPGPDGKLGFGGSCFPKDLNAMLYFAKKFGISANTLEGAWKTNLQVRPGKDWEQLKGRAVVD